MFYINGLFKFIENVNILMFADDCILFKHGKDWDHIRNDLQHALDVYIRWGNDQNLTLMQVRLRQWLFVIM